jgi:hypothetical protein
VKPKVVDARLVTPPTRVAPATRIIDQIGGDYMTVRQVSEHFGVHIETIRRLTKAYNKDGTKKVNAPSKATQQGDMVIYLFTPADVAEIGDYFEGKKSRRRKAQ